MRIALLPARLSNRPVREHFETTIRAKVRFDDHLDLLDTETLSILLRIFPDGAARMWAVTPGVNTGKWAKLDPGDPVAFCGDNKLHALSHIAARFQNEALAERLWGRDAGGRSWANMFALAELRTVDVPVQEVRRAIGWRGDGAIPGFTVIEGAPAENLADLVNLETDLGYSEGLVSKRAPSSVTVPEGATDGIRETTFRREQRALKHRLRQLSAGRCALCGRAFPDQLLIAAHIKRRGQCTEDERKDLENIGMLACAVGCDSLFEHGYIGVDYGGKLLVSNATQRSGDIRRHVDDHLRGRVSPWWTSAREPYFAWHRTRIFQELAEE
ncbi:hypothetical protein [Nocardia aurantiaca]|uniref:HNH endonuclease n=1 Tax=Nocardia aurantiaca TaxID=2675850 RepID=A0A6I3KTN2_9NOCA|nr:hypothetical protein [Nocardia aurantiaca]MTE14153.1 hypothetical protein [Nocardia aurantiaca]